MKKSKLEYGALPNIGLTLNKDGSLSRSEKWTLEEEKKWLTENYSNLGKENTAALLQRSTSSIRAMASYMRLKSGFRFNPRAVAKRASKLRGRKRPEHAEWMRTHPVKNPYNRSKQGHYDINGKDFFFRSSWEANYALYLDFLIKQEKILSWEFEKDVFWFEKIKRGVRSYLPDFKVVNLDASIEYHEVKGWMDDKSRTKLKRMSIYHPQVKLVLIDKEPYGEIKKKLGILLKFW